MKSQDKYYEIAAIPYQLVSGKWKARIQLSIDSGKTVDQQYFLEKDETEYVTKQEALRACKSLAKSVAKGELKDVDPNLIWYKESED